MKNIIVFFVCLILFNSCSTETKAPTKEPEIGTTSVVSIQLDLEQANRLSELPINCISNPFPYKSGVVIADSSDLQYPQVHHPAFYGCFDWHSAVHGHWSLIYLMKTFPDLKDQEKIIEAFNQNITEENIATEIAYFDLNKYSKSFERTYGWAWLLKLSEELYTWEDERAQRWYTLLQPLAQLISKKYIEYLPKLVYPIRVGEHSNTAFGMSFAYDYAKTVGDEDLKNAIEKSAKKFYSPDKNCPINWEPSGYDFLSPCLQELDIMRKVLPEEDFEKWMTEFLPGLQQRNLNLNPAKVIDRSDGKLVHLDGLNFSRAWCLFSIADKNRHAHLLANEHLKYSLDKITDGEYAGEHWLASFALYAFKCSKDLADGKE